MNVNQFCKAQCDWYRKYGHDPKHRIICDTQGVEYVIGDMSWNVMGRYHEYIEKIPEFRALAIDVLKCEDCGKLYSEFIVDTILPDEQWLMIHPEGEGGILCPNCMIQRASKLSGMIGSRMVFEFFTI